MVQTMVYYYQVWTILKGMMKMSAIGDFIKARRTELGLSRNALAQKAGISHTEIHRIEIGERKEPSLKTLTTLAVALGISQEEMLRVAGYAPSEDRESTEALFPELKSQKQKETIEKIAHGLARNSDLKDEDLDELYEQMEMFINYRAKKNSK